MIARLSGELVANLGHNIIVDCQGVGYEVSVSSYTAARLPPVGDSVVLRIYTQVMETKIALYGFAEPEERELFDLLITVKKVGPSSAITILSAGAGPQDVARMIVGGEVSSLTKLRGVGKKTAELLIVELRDKCEVLLATWGAGSANSGVRDVIKIVSPPRVSDPRVADVIAALCQLGWKNTDAERVAAELQPGEGDTIETLLRQALRAMPR